MAYLVHLKVPGIIHGSHYSPLFSVEIIIIQGNRHFDSLTFQLPPSRRPQNPVGGP